MTKQEIQKTTKRINQRLLEFENKGLTDAKAYRKLIDALKMSGFELTTKNRLSSSKTNIDKMFKSQEKLDKIDKMPTLASEVKRAKKYGAKTTKDIYENIKQRGKLEQWAEENLEYVYKDTLSGMEEANDVMLMFTQGKTKKMSYDAVWALIHRYEKAVEERNKIFKDSNFNKGFFQ